MAADGGEGYVPPSNPCLDSSNNWENVGEGDIVSIIITAPL